LSQFLINSITYYSAVIFGVIGCIIFIKIDWKRYGALFLLSGVSAIIICYLFVLLGFYSYPELPIKGLKLPLLAMMVTFPLGVMFGVRYSPERWIWKIPFYWGIIHIGVFLELLIKLETTIFTFGFAWDLWDSYTWWWIYFLLFEWIGGKIVPSHLRKPISEKQFRYGQWGWLIFHAIVITTIFLAGYYLGRISAE
jgi:hypothetical protein